LGPAISSESLSVPLLAALLPSRSPFFPCCILFSLRLSAKE
jgi:hypothetical protein